MAVASLKGSFGLLALKDLREIKNSIDKWDPRDPSTILPISEVSRWFSFRYFLRLTCSQQMFVQVDGNILRMDFLRSSPTEPQRVVLLLVVANRGVSRLLLYKWDSWQPLMTFKPLKCSGYILPTEDAFPHLLIPSYKPLSFAIVTEDKLVYYDDITSSNKIKRMVNIPASGDQPGKYWVQWAKPVRHEEHRKEKEDLFLVREDGLLRSAIVTHDSTRPTHISFSPGHLGIRVDTAVCALSGQPLQGGDVLIVCGDTTDGGVFRLEARKSPEHIQSLANWSPITDVVLLKERDGPSAIADEVRILATTGIHDNRAFLTELRYGIEAQLVEPIEHGDAASVDRLWVLYRPSQERQLLLTSHHEHSSITCFQKGKTEPFAAGEDMYPSLGFDSPTLAACNLNFDSILQITTTEIHVLGLTEHSPADKEALKGRFICADIHPGTGLFVIANRFEQSLQLVGGIAMVEPDHNINVLPLPKPQVIDYLPISLTIVDMAGRKFFMAGSLDGCLHLYDLAIDHGITACRTWSVSSFHQALDDPKISSVAILSLPRGNHGLVICGFKTGQVMILELKMQSTATPESALLSLIQFQALGSTAVFTSVDEATPTSDEVSAYVTCGSALFQIRLYYNTTGLDFTLNPLLPTADPQHHGPYQNPSFNAIAYVAGASPTVDGLLSGVLVGFTDNALLVLMLGESALIPKQISLIKPTHHLVHSAHLRKCIASVATKKVSGPMNADQTLQARPSLQMLDIGVLHSHERDSRVASHVYFGEEGEKIRALLHWSPTNGRTHYEMIVVGSEHDGDGRLSYITAKRLSQSKEFVSATTFITYSKKTINAMCEYGLSSLLVCAGRELKLVHLDLSTKPPRWEHQAEIELPSRATELRTKGSVVYVATSLHSYMLIREQDKKFYVIGSDKWAGKARHVLPYGDGSTLVNLVSDRGSRILNFAERPFEGTRPTFESNVPEAIDKLVHIESSASDSAHERFLGTTIDGTVYMFTTLNEQEMRLLGFLEELCQPMRDQAAKSASMLARRLAHHYRGEIEAAGVKVPSFQYTHARGDVLKTLLTPGPYNISFLLQQRIKTEDVPLRKAEDELESLRDAARPVLGQTQDVVEGVILWLRKLLNVPLF